MKKFIMTIVSLVLAGSMAFGLAACGNKTNPDDNKDDTNNNQPGDNNNEGDGGNGGEGGAISAEGWAKLFDGLGELDSYTLTTGFTEGSGLKYNGEYVTEDTTFSNPTLGMMVPMLLEMMDLDEKNPNTYEDTSVEKYDFKRGIVEESSYVGEDKMDYAVVNGTTINTYNWSRRFDDGEEVTYLSGRNYTGYTSNAQALAVFKAENDPFERLLSQEFSGTGEHANVNGNIYELYSIFEYDEAAGVYSATVAAPESYYPEGTEVKVEFKIENGAIVKYTYQIAIESTLVELMENMDGDLEGVDMSVIAPMLEGFTYEFFENEYIQLTNVNSTTINVPGNIEEQVVSSRTYMVVSDETAYKDLFNNLGGNEGTVRLSCNGYEEDIYKSIDAQYNADLNLLKITQEVNDYENDIHERQTKLYWATDDGMKIYTAEYDETEYGYLEFKCWSNYVETEEISGDKTAALMELLPAEMQLYFNLNGKPMAEQFSLFKFVGYDEFEANVTVNGEELRIGLSYDYNEQSDKFNFYGYSVRNNDDYSYVSLSTGNLTNSNEGLPEVDGTPVTEAEWKAIVEPWYNLKNVTIENGGDKIIIDIAADGKSGKIYNVSEYEGSRRYIEFECTDGSTYTVTIYSCQYSGWDDENHKEIFTWYKEQYEEVEYEWLLNESGAYILSYLNENLGNSWANVTYNSMTKGYVYNEGEYENYTILVGEGKFTFNGWTLSNKGTTVVGEIPADILAGAIER